MKVHEPLSLTTAAAYDERNHTLDEVIPSCEYSYTENSEARTNRAVLPDPIILPP